MTAVLNRLYWYFTQALGRLCGWLTLLMVLVTVYDVVLRFGFSAGSVAVQELEWHLFGAVILLGAAYTLRKDEHVRVDLLYGRLGTRGKAAIDLLGTLLFLLPFCAAVFYVSLPFVERAYELGEHSENPGGLPYRYAVKALIPAGFLLLTLEGVRQIFRNIGILVYGPSYFEWSEAKRVGG